jgi:hypothetical protein
LKGFAVHHEKETEKWIEQLRDADERGLQKLEQSLVHKRIVWFRENNEIVQQLKGDLLERAYRLLLVKQLDPSLRFSRNYQSIRPYCDFCEEMISLIDFPENPSYHK